MNIYRNSYFKLQLEFFLGWRFRCRSNREKPPESTEYLQCQDDDFPSDEDGYKTLFTSVFLVKESPTVMSSQLSMEVHRREYGFDLESRLPRKDGELSRVLETGDVLGFASQSLKMEHECDGYVLTQEVVIWKAAPKLWLSACISGDTLDNFKHAKLQFSKLAMSG